MPAEPHVNAERRGIRASRSRRAALHGGAARALLAGAVLAGVLGAPADVAFGLGLSLPTGDADDFQGTGTTHVLPSVIASRVLASRVELLANVGMELDASDVGRSAVPWALGGTISLMDRLAAPIVFLGRHELGAPADPIRLPFFFQIHRSDAVDASVGLRWSFAESALLSANALVPLTRDGLRADVVPTVGVEWRY